VPSAPSKPKITPKAYSLGIDVIEQASYEIEGKRKAIARCLHYYFT